jgi:transcriptional regulator with XRE-family HTH domain
MEATAIEEITIADLPPSFGKLLQSRREEASLTIAALASKSGLTRNTIVNIEQGLTAPSPQTMRRLLAIKALRLHDLGSSEGPQVEAWFTEAYNPIHLVNGMTALLNGPGGRIDQTYLYLDPRSAVDYFVLCNTVEYVSAYRGKIPFDRIAERLLKESRGVGLDVDGLGCGDGKSETALMQRLADRMPAPPDLQLYLLDISHVLLSEGYRTALNSLAPRRIPVFAIHGNFNDIAKNPVLYMHPVSIKRLRVFLLFGGTFGNINDEPWFFEDLAACAQPGDMTVLDCQLTRAPIEQPEQIRSLEPLLKAGHPPEAHHKFLAGPLKRHCEGLTHIKLRSVLSTHCLIPGSYAIEFWGDIDVEYEPKRRFMIQRVKRYDLDKLSQFLSTIGWKTLQAWKYGPDKLAAVLLLQKQ